LFVKVVEMSERRYYSAGTEEALHLLSGGGCYWPGCGEPTIRFRVGKPEKNVVVAHIHAFEDDGPRAIVSMSTKERNAFPNLILLCHPCHKIVDNDEGTYTAELLKGWKADREQQPVGSLAGLRDLDQASMETLLNDAMSDVREDMSKVAAMFPELSHLLRGVMEHLPELDPASISLLHDAATSLRDLPENAMILREATRELPNLPDSAAFLFEATRDLRGLPDGASFLFEATRDLRGLAEAAALLFEATRFLPGLAANAAMLDEAASKLGRLHDDATTLNDAANKLVNLPDHTAFLESVSDELEQTLTRSTSEISAAATRIKAAGAAIPAASKPVVPPTPIASRRPNSALIKPEWYWKAMVAGWTGWACFGLAMLIVWLNTKGH
jgi:hypothetical protein